MAARLAAEALPPTDAGLPDDVVSLVVRACAADPSRPAILFEDGLEVSRQGLVERVERFAGFLRGRVSPGDRVAIAVGNRAEFMIAWIAAMARGATLVPLNTTARRRDAAHLLRDSEAVLAIVDLERRELIESLVGQSPQLAELVILSDSEPDGLAEYGGAADLSLEEARVDPSAITNVYYTSGTTGPPKGCMVDHAYWLRFVDLYRRIYGMGPDDRLLTCLNFFYNDPSWHLLTALHSGSTFVAMRRFSVSRFWDVVRRRGITQLFGIAAIPSLLLTAPPGPRDTDHDVRFAVQVGIPTPEVHHRLVERWGFHWLELYGLTETGIVTAVPPALGGELVGSGSIGPPAPEVDLRLAAGNGGISDEQGEIEVRAPGMMRGYLGRPQATEEAFRDGWFRTGDLARRDRDGLLYFEGRIKDVIRRSGENVAAAEVEAVLCEHPDVAEAAVLPVPDHLRGEEIKAHVRLRPGVSPEAVPPRELADHCGERLAPHKVPRFIEYRSDFPRTPSMRVAKRELLESDADPRSTAWDREGEDA